MNILKYFFCLFAIVYTSSLFAQSKDPALVRIDDDLTITESEFEYAYKKHPSNTEKDKESVGKFLESYINFKLSVEEAKKQGLNKDKGFVSEYSTYLEQLEKPYLIDSITPQALSKEIYKRLKENIEVSHLFLRLPTGYILPKDTVNLYNEILNIRKSINKESGSSFEELVTKFSQDSISKNSITPGYLGWRTAFSARYPFEESIYTLPLNSISDPVRTTEGYHLIKVLSKKPDPGQVNMAHIVLLYPNPNPTQQEKDSVYNVAMQIYKRLNAGENFNSLCSEYSDDKETSSKGGNLGWFGVNRPAPPIFEKMWFEMKQPGEITPPTEIYYGYHIFKLIAKTPLLPWEMMKDNLIDAIQNSDRKDILTLKQIEYLSREYSYKVEKNVYTKLQNAANEYTLSDTVYFNTIYPIYDEVLLKVKNNNYTVKDFVLFLDNNPDSDYYLSTDILKQKFDQFILNRLLEAKRLELPDKYPDFRYLAQEFYDGMLFFDIMNKNVWQKAHAERASLEKLFEENYPKYKWENPKYKGYVIHARDKSMMKKVKEIIAKNKKDNNLSRILITSLNNDSIQNIIVDKGLWAKGENGYVDKLVYNVDTTSEIIGYTETIVEGKLISEPEELNDALGVVTTDYQKILENEWYDALRKKYSVQINETVLENIKNKH